MSGTPMPLAFRTTVSLLQPTRQGQSMTDRVINFQGIHNFRDYGGYAVKGGGRLKRDKLWRSGQHIAAPPLSHNCGPTTVNR